MSVESLLNEMGEADFLMAVSEAFKKKAASAQAEARMLPRDMAKVIVDISHQFEHTASDLRRQAYDYRKSIGR